MNTVGAFTAAQIRAAEAPLLAAGVPLMHRAAGALAQVVAEGSPRRMLVLAGAGDNGGDALYAAASAARAGTQVDILRTAERVHDEALAAAREAGAAEVDLATAAAGEYEVVLDGILGIGARGGLRGAAREAVRELQASAERAAPSVPRVIAVDLPSGLDPDDGTTDGVVLPAALTVTFGGVKAGLACGSGPEFAGRIVLVDLGLELRDPVASVEVDEVRRG